MLADYSKPKQIVSIASMRPRLSTSHHHTMNDAPVNLSKMSHTQYQASGQNPAPRLYSESSVSPIRQEQANLCTEDAVRLMFQPQVLLGRPAQQRA